MQEVDLRRYKPPKKYRCVQFTVTMAVEDPKWLPRASAIESFMKTSISGLRFARVVAGAIRYNNNAADVREFAGLPPDSSVHDKLK